MGCHSCRPHTVYRVERVFTALLPNKIAHTVFIVALLYQRAFIVNIVLEPEQLFIEQLWMAQIDRVFRYIMTVFHAQANVQLGKQRRRQEQNSVSLTARFVSVLRKNANPFDTLDKKPRMRFIVRYPFFRQKPSA